MPDTSTEMQKKGERSPKQQDLAWPGCYGVLHRSIGLRATRRGDQPGDQADGASGKTYARDPIGD
jgi:hypothetical protein